MILLLQDRKSCLDKIRHDDASQDKQKTDSTEQSHMLVQYDNAEKGGNGRIDGTQYPRALNGDMALSIGGESKAESAAHYDEICEHPPLKRSCR